MSRCYPFLPPGYVRNETRDVSLIESIKGAREEVKKDRKHKKDKKRKERENEKHRHKRRRKDESANASKKVDDGRGLMITEVAFLEKSCLTVDVELQTSSQNSCDSTLHSNERPEQSQTQSQPPLDGRHNDSETGIRVRSPGKGQKDPEAEVMMTNEDQKHRSSSQAAPSESVGHPYLISLSEASRDSNFGSSIEITTKLSKEEKTIPLRDNRKISRQLVKEKPSSSHQETTGPSRICRKCPPSTAVRFLNLIENWAPDRVESKLTDSEDQEWWLVMKFGAKRHHPVSNQTTINGSSSMVWPTARFLPEVELDALPFTVPF